MSSAPAPELPRGGQLVLVLLIIATFSGLILVFAYQLTREPIARNQREAIEQAVFEVLPGAVSRVNYLLGTDGLRKLPDQETDRANAFAGYDKAGGLVGVAFEASARGYSDEIRVLYGYSPARQSIIGFSVLESSETPGLGQKIQSDPGFLASFEGLDVRLNGSRTALEHDIEVAASPAQSKPWTIDAVSGATISSTAVARALRESANEKLPLLDRHLDELMKEAN